MLQSTAIQILLHLAVISTSKTCQTFPSSANNHGLEITSSKLLETKFNTPSEFYSDLFWMCKWRGLYQRFYKKSENEKETFLDEFQCLIHENRETNVVVQRFCTYDDQEIKNRFKRTRTVAKRRKSKRRRRKKRKNLKIVLKF